MKIILFLCVVLLSPLQAMAQTASGQIPETVFGEEEKRIITDYLFKKIGLPETAKTTSSDTANGASEASDEDDEDEPKAKGKGKKDKKSKKNKGKGKAKGKGKSKKMPPGLAKRKELPPGLARRHALPPGLAVRELPAELEEQLPPPEKGQQRIIADENVVLIEQATGRILDIILGSPQSSGGAQ